MTVSRHDCLEAEDRVFLLVDTKIRKKAAKYDSDQQAQGRLGEKLPVDYD